MSFPHMKLQSIKVYTEWMFISYIAWKIHFSVYGFIYMYASSTIPELYWCVLDKRSCPNLGAFN